MGLIVHWMATHELNSKKEESKQIKKTKNAKNKF
jgi:hypothetical protein